jgi:hypothetical protein
MKGALFVCGLRRVLKRERSAFEGCPIHLLFLCRPHDVHSIRAVIHDFIHSLSTAGPMRRPAGLPHAPAASGWGIPPGNKTENTIAPFCVKTYHGFMTTWQALKRAGYMHPDSSLEAALFSNRCGVVAV